MPVILARGGTPTFHVGEQELALTTFNGSGLGDIASRFLKFCRVPLRGMVTWGKI